MSTAMPEGTALTRELPSWLKLVVADAVVLFGSMEQEAIEIAWVECGRLAA